MSKITKIPVLIFTVLFTVSSCDKNNKNVNDIYHKWEVVDFLSPESLLYAKDNDFNPKIEFQENGSYTLQLDANNCSGNFILSEQDLINISEVGCTKMCCDSDFSNKIKEMLPQVNSYSIEKNKLKLNVPGWGWINLELNN